MRRQQKTGKMSIMCICLVIKSDNEDIAKYSRPSKKALKHRKHVNSK